MIIENRVDEICIDYWEDIDHYEITFYNKGEIVRNVLNLHSLQECLDYISSNCIWHSVEC